MDKPFRPLPQCRGAAQYLAFVLLVVFSVPCLWAAESPFVGSWRKSDSTAEIALKSDGSGSLKLPDGGKIISFKWEKTPQGATAQFGKPSEAFAETNLLFRLGSNAGQM